jgi:prepilin-type processing-associated H-X9-DG protein
MSLNRGDNAPSYTTYSNRHLGQTINYQFVDGHGDSRTSDWVVEELNKYSATVGGRSMFFQNDGDL